VRAEYDTEFLTCTVAPCTTPTVLIPAGNQLPGVPSKTGFAEIAWRQPWFTTALEVRAVDRVFVNDQNNDAAGGYAIANWRLIFEQRVRRWSFSEFVRVDNLFDRKYSGSVIVNEGNLRFFEPAPGRHYLIGVSAQYRF
jgi:iron complex outermembrane recepter protein